MGNTSNEKRLHQRIELRGLAADIDDGNGVFNGYIENISSGGFKTNLLSLTFRVEAKQFTSVVSGFNKKFIITIQPCWNQKAYRGHYLEVGFKILQPPSTWTKFVTEMQQVE